MANESQMTLLPPLRGSAWLRPVCAVIGHATRYHAWRPSERGWSRRVDCVRCRYFVAEGLSAGAPRPLDINPPKLPRFA